MAVTFFQVSAGFDLSCDLLSAGYNEFDTIVPDDSQLVGQHFSAPVNGPITVAGPWSMQWQMVKSGNIGGSYSAGSVWSGVQVFTTPDGMWTRKADRVFSNGAMTFTPWLKVLDFNCPGVTY